MTIYTSEKIPAPSSPPHSYFSPLSSLFWHSVLRWLSTTSGACFNSCGAAPPPSTLLFYDFSVSPLASRISLLSLYTTTFVLGKLTCVLNSAFCLDWTIETKTKKESKTKKKQNNIVTIKSWEPFSDIQWKFHICMLCPWEVEVWLFLFGAESAIK